METNGGGVGMEAHAQEIWQQIHNDLRAFIAKRVDNEAEVDDIVQDVWLKMQRGLDGLKDQGRLSSSHDRTFVRRVSASGDSRRS